MSERAHEQPAPPASMAELQATDAMLDRIAAGDTDPALLDDLAFTLLAELAAESRSDEQELPTGSTLLARLEASLDGRPLFLLPEAELGGSPADAGLIHLDDPSWRDEPELIDLRPLLAESEIPDVALSVLGPAPAGERFGPHRAHSPRAALPGVVTRLLPVARRASDDRSPQPAAGPRIGLGHPARQAARLLRQLPLPVAAAIVAFALGSGVAAVSGDPMAPLNGVSKMVSELSGQPAQPEQARESVQQKITAARVAVAHQDYARANDLLNQARSSLREVKGSDAAKLQQSISALSQQVPGQLSAEQPLPVPTPTDVAPAPSIAPTGEPTPSASTESPAPTPSSSITPSDTETGAPPTSTAPSPSSSATPSASAADSVVP